MNDTTTIQREMLVHIGVLCIPPKDIFRANYSGRVSQESTFQLALKTCTTRVENLEYTISRGPAKNPNGWWIMKRSYSVSHIAFTGLAGKPLHLQNRFDRPPCFRIFERLIDIRKIVGLDEPFIWKPALLL